MDIQKDVWSDLLAVGDRLAPRLRRAFLDAIAKLRGELTSSAVADLTGGAHPTAGELWQRIQELLEPTLREAVWAVVIGAGQLMVSRFPTSVQVQLPFDRTNPFAVDAVDSVVGDAVQDIANASQDAIQFILREGFTDGLTVDEMARRLRATIGLTDRYAQAVENYRNSLMDQEVSVGRANELADKYAQRLLSLRATTIARTETMRASGAGQHAAWQEAVERKLLEPERTRRMWVVTPDDRLCPLCEAVPDMNPDGVALNEPFQTPVGSLMYNPLHIQCRCVITLHFLEAA